MIGVVIDLILFVGVIVLIKYKKPNRHALVVVPPGHRFNRLQSIGLAYLLLGVVITIGLQIINRFHPMDPSFRAGELGGSEGFILIGVVFFLIGWNRRQKSDTSSLN